MINILAEYGIGITEGAAGFIATVLLTLIGKDKMDKHKNGKNGNCTKYMTEARCNDRHRVIEQNNTEIKKKIDTIQEHQAKTSASVLQIATILDERLPKNQNS